MKWRLFHSHASVATKVRRALCTFGTAKLARRGQLSSADAALLQPVVEKHIRTGFDRFCILAGHFFYGNIIIMYIHVHTGPDVRHPEGWQC